MKTLIAFVLCIVLAESRFRPPLEVFEIRETNERHPQLYVKNHNEMEELQEDDSPLSKLLNPYKRNKNNVVEKVAKELIDKLKFLRETKHLSNGVQEIYVIDANMLADSSHSSEDEEKFNDATRVVHKHDVKNIYPHLLPQKKSRSFRPVHTGLRSFDDRTAAPRHKYLYEEDN